MLETLIAPLVSPLYALSTLATTVTLSWLFHMLAKPVALEALSSVDPSPKHLRHADRVVTNFAKAGCLFLLTVNPLFWFTAYEAFWSDRWEDLAFTRMVVILYTVTDLSSFLTTWMPKRTAFHHGVTGLFAIVTCAYQEILTLVFPRLMLWYGLCSTITYLVNFFIGTLYCFKQPLKTLASYSAAIYALSLGINWIKYMPALTAMLLEERLFFVKLLDDYGVCHPLLTLLLPWIERLSLAGITAILVHDDMKLLQSLIDFSGGMSSTCKLENLKKLFPSLPKTQPFPPASPSKNG